MIKSIKRKLPEVWRKRLVFALKVLIATGLVIFLFTSGRIKFAVLVNSYKYPVYLLSGILCCTLALITPIYRWWILSRVQKLPLKAFDAFRLTMTGYFFNLFIPGGIGGDAFSAPWTKPGAGHDIFLKPS